jgi:hypothetical protein
MEDVILTLRNKGKNPHDVRRIPNDAGPVATGKIAIAISWMRALERLIISQQVSTHHSDIQQCQLLLPICYETKSKYSTDAKEESTSAIVTDGTSDLHGAKNGIHDETSGQIAR